MGTILYYLITFAESGLSVFGIRGTYEQPRYAVMQTITPGIEIRAYAARVAVETDAVARDGRAADGEAFGRLFRYITGANAGGHTIAMTAPVEEKGARIAMTVPVEHGPADGDRTTMRFFLPAGVAARGAPAPTDPAVRLVHLPPVTMAVLRFSGWPSPAATARARARLAAAIAAAGRAPQGEPVLLSYDPPFTIPFLRRNEVAQPLTE